MISLRAMYLKWLPAVAVAMAAWSGTARAATPVLVELFTSEGCSSCPPADRLLLKLDTQPVAGAELIVLSEHVDYWNHIGWKDPYSAHWFSERQSAYAKRFGLGSVYTPQMVVNGRTQFVGSDAEAAEKAVSKELGSTPLAVGISAVRLEGGSVAAHVEVEKMKAAAGAEVYVGLALNRAASQVSSGENAGHRLEHVAVVKSLQRIGVAQAQGLAQEIRIKLPAGMNADNLRLVVFVQQPREGRVLGAAVARLAVAGY